MNFESALIRWSVVCKRWGELSAGSAPVLHAFLAGWFMHKMGADMPENVGPLRDSFRVGWRESEINTSITNRSTIDRGQTAATAS